MQPLLLFHFCFNFILFGHLLILILIDVQYSQKAIFSFEKDSNCQNHSSPGFLYPVKKSPPPPSGNLPAPLTAIRKTLGCIMTLKSSLKAVFKPAEIRSKVQIVKITPPSPGSLYSVKKNSLPIKFLILPQWEFTTPSPPYLASYIAVSLQIYHTPMYGILLSCLGWCPYCYLELLDKLQK